jgi:hypothetical protein
MKKQKKQMALSPSDSHMGKKEHLALTRKSVVSEPGSVVHTAIPATREIEIRKIAG